VKDDPSNGGSGSELTRRGFLRLVGASASLGLVEACGGKTPSTRTTPTACAPLLAARTPADWHDEELYRRDDLLHLRIRFIGFVRDGNRLVRAGTRPPMVVVQFPLQHVLERAFPAQAMAKAPVPIPLDDVRAGSFGSTRLVFNIDERVRELPYDLPTMLAWGQVLETAALDGRYTPRLVPLSKNPRAPEGLDGVPETAIEMPLHLFLNPVADGAWVHAARVTRSSSGHVELWSTQLVPRRSQGRLERGAVGGYAVWADDYRGYRDEQGALLPATTPPPSAEGYRTTLTPVTDAAASVNEIQKRTLEVRAALVDKTLGVATGAEPEPFKIHQLALTSLGGWLNVRGDWDPPSPPSPPSGGGGLEVWRHVTTGGRDQYARVQVRVYLFPYGHKASVVSETEREFEPTAEAPIAALRQRQYIAIREREKDYRDSAYGTRQIVNSCPHPIVRFLAERSPDLPDKNFRDPAGLPAGTYVPMLGPNRPVMFELQGVDHEGTPRTFYSPVIVVENQHVRRFSVAELDQLNTVFTKLMAAMPPLDSAVIAYTPIQDSKSTGAVDSRLLTHSLIYAGQVATPAPYFAPILHRAKIRHRALQQLMRTAATLEITYLSHYRDHGFDPDMSHGKLGAFAQVLDQNAWIDFAPPDAPGESLQLITPNMAIKTLSATAGPLGIDATQFAKGIDFKTFFAGISNTARSFGRILGGIKLGTIFNPIKPGDLSLQSVGTHIPKLTMTDLPDGGHCVEYTWASDLLTDDPTGTFIANDGKQHAALAVTARVCTSSSGEPVERRVTAKLTNFSLVFLGKSPFLKLRFTSFSVTKQAGRADDVDVKLAGLEFDGALRFIDDLARAAEKALLGGKRFPIRLVGTDLQLRYPIRLPSISAGAFAIENLAFMVGADIPLTGDPLRVVLGFAERSSPFLVSAGLLAGGGWLEVRVSTDPDAGARVESVEGALELGGNLSLNLGAAQGRAYAFVGIYFRFEGGAVTVGGYVRLTGALDILGLITISVEIFLGLNYESNRNALIGTARMTICIEIMFFSSSVTLEVQRCFKASSSGVCSILPVSEDDLAAVDWPAYWAAFA
jgi:hypothetical protein